MILSLKGDFLNLKFLMLKVFITNYGGFWMLSDYFCISKSQVNNFPFSKRCQKYNFGTK